MKDATDVQYRLFAIIIRNREGIYRQAHRKERVGVPYIKWYARLDVRTYMGNGCDELSRRTYVSGKK